MMKRFLSILLFLFFALPLLAQDPILVINEEDEAAPLAIDIILGNRRGEAVKDINGINQGPFLKYNSDDYRLNWFGELGVPIYRAHDQISDPGLYPMDLNHIFPIETADPSKREFYDFSTTDAFFKMMEPFGMKLLWHLGSSIENMDEYHYEIHPPKSAKQWAEVAVNVLEHYAKGKWDGFYYDIPYAEIWNEPDNRHCWSGTMEEFTDFYITASKIIKKKCPWVKVGGPAFCSPREKPAKPFIDACADAGAPLDFFSYHWYVYKEGDDSKFLDPSSTVRKWLDDAGYKDTEIFFDEWHPITGWKNVKRDLNHDWSVLTASIMLGFQDSDIDKAFFYTGSTTGWGYAANGKIQPVYYAAKAVGQLRRYPTRLLLESQGLPKGSRAMASIDEQGNVTALVALYKTGKCDIAFDISQCGPFGRAEVYLFDETHNLQKIAAVDQPEKEIQINTFCPSSLVLLKLQREATPQKRSSVRISAVENGLLKPLNGGNSGPSLKSRSIHFKTKYYGSMRIPITRVSNECRENSGMRLISTNQIFPLATGNPADRQFYDFRASDDYLAQIQDIGNSKIFYCLSAADERLIHREHFRIFPPDPEQWKIVCENIIRHYNHGKWDGRRDGITYWELWDEPDNPHHWGGTLEQYCNLYVQTAKYLKALFPELKIGGPCFGHPDDEKVRTFLAACKKAGAPLDFFSFKLFSYNKGDYKRFVGTPARLRALLDEAGFRDTELILSSWHPVRGERDDIGGAVSIEWASLIASMMLSWQDSPLDIALFETTSDRLGGVYSVPKPNSLYYLFIAMADVMEHPRRLQFTSDGLSPESRAIASRNAKGDVDVLLALHTEQSLETLIDFSELGTFSTAEIFRMDKQEKTLSQITTIQHPGKTLTISHAADDAIILLKLKK